MSDKQTKTRICPWWLAYTFDNPLRRFWHDPRKLFGPFVEPGATVLDIGCGLGWASLGLARLVGPDGVVFAVDVQPRMLAALERRARRAGLTGRIKPILISAESFELDRPVDFALGFWLVHEVADQAGLFGAVLEHLKPDGRFLVVEPHGHVLEADFRASVDLACRSGFEHLGQPPIGKNLTALLRPNPVPE